MPDVMHVSFPPEIAENIKQHFLRTDMAKTVKIHGVVFVEFNNESATITGGKRWNQLGMTQTIKKVVKKLAPRTIPFPPEIRSDINKWCFEYGSMRIRALKKKGAVYIAVTPDHTFLVRVAKSTTSCAQMDEVVETLKHLVKTTYSSHLLSVAASKETTEEHSSGLGAVGSEANTTIVSAQPKGGGKSKKAMKKARREARQREAKSATMVGVEIAAAMA